MIKPVVVFVLAVFGSIQPVVSQSVMLNGNASSLGGGCYSVTPNQAWQNGAVWYTTPLDLTQPFALEFTVNFGANDANGADGMVFVFQTEGVNALGIDGGGMGFEGFNPSFGIEFDTFQNNNPGAPNDDNSDPPYDHIAFQRNGNVNHASPNNLAGPVQASATNQNIEDNLPHNIRITWDPATQQIACYFDCVLRLSYTTDLIDGIFSGQSSVYFGFTGSTGFYYNSQSVCISDYVLSVNNPTPVCPGQGVLLSAGGTGSGTYQWSPTTGLSNPTGQSTVATPVTTTLYTVTHTNSCGLPSTLDILVQVTEPAELEVIPDITICPGSTAVLTAQIPQSTATIGWSTSNGTITGPSNQVSVTVSSAGIYTLTTTSTQGCTSQASTVVSEWNHPQWFIPDPVYYLCSEETFTLTVPSGNYSHTWLPGSSGQAQQSFSQPGAYQLNYQWQSCATTYSFIVAEVELNVADLGPDQHICESQPLVLNAGAVVTWNTGVTAPSIAVSQTGTYSFLYSLNGCTASDAISITVDAMPLLELGGPFGLCSGDTLLLAIPYNGQWSTGQVGSQLEVSAPGIYGVSVSTGLCTATDTAEITAIPDPVADLGEQGRYCQGDVVTLSAIHPSNESVVWENGSTSPVRTIESSGVYIVIAQNSCGFASSSVAVEFEDCDVFIYIPNAFSPDNDGLNDAWKPVVHNLDAYELWIYDRWGTEIFYTSDPHAHWMGNVRGGSHHVPAGAYIYRFVYDKNSSEKEELRGWVVVVR